MNTIIGVFANLHSVVSCVWRLLGYALRFLWLLLRPKAVLAAKILALRVPRGSDLSKSLFTKILCLNPGSDPRRATGIGGRKSVVWPV